MTKTGTLGSADAIARLKHVRRIRGLSADDLARLCGMSRSVIANMESGRRGYLTVDDLNVMCEALGVDPIAVLSDEPLPVVATA
ncbi:helix-turn-helix protein [Pseudonocardia sediminis]|uniref:Helix-turn-helix protein n=1 Tax=Pseudonocardia sediminis TaxID=1397368 RepID=A0A4V2FR70_PSEST|nr:helix-turn-helix transcriptional regulator [Pseudonocardia sediminis]RZT87420.1 helix-turn-helix protein [Pseudonocardia sediminis]